ncbi:MAG: hypothetical protein QOE77_2013 [Blastocatellia bacterium]|jgi:hypothetical protein|nr:hypothetical protein [Blastocatellia bacterium]
MDPLENIVQEITAFENHLNRRTFLGMASLIFILPRVSTGTDDHKFLSRVAATLIPAAAIADTGIDVAANVEYLLQQGSFEHREKVLRFLSWSRRASIVYGGDRVAINARGSRFILVRKMGRTLSSLCLIAFWADERSLKLISPEVKA